MTGLSGSGYIEWVPEDDPDSLLYTVSRNKLYKTGRFSNQMIFVANLQSPSTAGFEAGLDIVDNDPGDPIVYYSRTISTPSSLNSSVYTVSLLTGATARLLTTPNGVTLREIAL